MFNSLEYAVGFFARRGFPRNFACSRTWERFAQARFVKELALCDNEFDPAQFVGRVARFSPPLDANPSVRMLMRKYSRFALVFEPCLIVTHLSRILSRGCTNRRFGRGSEACPFG